MGTRALIDAECGGQNALVAASSHFAGHKRFQEYKTPVESSRHNLIGDQAHQFVDEFLLEQQAARKSDLAVGDQRFRMDALLREMDSMERTMPPPMEGFAGQGQTWANEFMGGAISDRYQPKLAPTVEQVQWANDYLAESEKNLQLQSMSSHLEQLDEKRREDDGLAREARRLLEANRDQQINDTEFMRFIRRVGNSEVTITNDGQVRDLTGGQLNADSLAREFVGTESEKWANDFVDQKDDDTEFWAKLAEEWKKSGLADETDDHPWLTEFEGLSFDPFKEGYKFNEENPMRDHPDPFEEGMKKLKEGDIPSAVLLFEAACQKDPESVAAWQFLGTSQAENEHDQAAILALKKCLELNPDNLTALMALAVSYTNESMQHQACATLKEWLTRNPKYRDIVIQAEGESQTQPETSKNLYNTIITSGQHEKVKDLYILAARLSPRDPDPDVQCGLGVLFNLSCEYEKATDCFQSALQVRPNDSHLWNRLGATLANGSHAEDAINAYREALRLSPGFIRSRFNLGISCINLGVYREAAEHFLTVLNLQAAGRGPQGSRPLMSANVWSTLRMVLTLMNRADLYNAVDSRDLNTLNAEFQMNPST